MTAEFGGELVDDARCAELDGLARAAQAGDESAAAQLKSHLADSPEVLDRVGNLAEHALEAWLRLITKQDAFADKAVRRKVENMRAELLVGQPSALQKLLVDLVVSNWLQVHYLTIGLSQVTDPAARPAQVLQQRQKQAQRQFESAIRTLTTVSKLAPRALRLLDPDGDGVRSVPVSVGTAMAEKQRGNCSRTASLH